MMRRSTTADMISAIRARPHITWVKRFTDFKLGNELRENNIRDEDEAVIWAEDIQDLGEGPAPFLSTNGELTEFPSSSRDIE